MLLDHCVGDAVSVAGRPARQHTVCCHWVGLVWASIFLGISTSEQVTLHMHTAICLPEPMVDSQHALHGVLLILTMAPFQGAVIQPVLHDDVRSLQRPYVSR